MKIILNIEKKHLYFLLLFLVFLGIGIVIASTWDNSQSHDTLWTTSIRGKNINAINVYDDLKLNNHRLLNVDWAGSAPLGSILYKNTGGCPLGYTSNTNAITTISSCSTPNSPACAGTFTESGQDCSFFNGNQRGCTLVGCYYDTYFNLCAGTIGNVVCSDYGCQSPGDLNYCDCQAVDSGCAWTTSSTTAYNTPLGRLVDF